jgi:hypothetical protein
VKLKRTTIDRPDFLNLEARQPTCYDARDPIRPWLAADDAPDDGEDRDVARCWAALRQFGNNTAALDGEPTPRPRSTRPPVKPTSAPRFMYVPPTPPGWQMRYTVRRFDQKSGKFEVELLPEDGVMLACFTVDGKEHRLIAGLPTLITPDAYTALRQDQQFIKVAVEPVNVSA